MKNKSPSCFITFDNCFLSQCKLNAENHSSGLISKRSKNQIKNNVRATYSPKPKVSFDSKNQRISLKNYLQIRSVGTNSSTPPESTNYLQKSISTDNLHLDFNFLKKDKYINENTITSPRQCPLNSDRTYKISESFQVFDQRENVMFDSFRFDFIQTDPMSDRKPMKK